MTQAIVEDYLPPQMQPIYEFLTTTEDESPSTLQYIERFTENVAAQFAPFPRLHQGVIIPLDVPSREDLLLPFLGNQPVYNVLREALDTVAGRYLTQKETKYYFSSVQQTFSINIPTPLFRQIMEENVLKSDAADFVDKFVEERLYNQNIRERFCFYGISLTDRFIFRYPRVVRNDWFAVVHSIPYYGQGNSREATAFFNRISNMEMNREYFLLRSFYERFGLKVNAMYGISEFRSKQLERCHLSHNLGLPYVNAQPEGCGHMYSSFFGDIINTNIRLGDLYKILRTRYEREDRPSYANFVQR